MGRNPAFDHACNVAIAMVAGAIGYLLSRRAVFQMVPVFAALGSIATLSIPARPSPHRTPLKPRAGCR
jgi:hypothetical protein